MTTSTSQPVERFYQVTAAILRLTLRIDEIGVDTDSEGAAVLLGNETEEGRALNQMLDEYRLSMADFQAATLQLFGERPASGENEAEFFGRIYRMSAEEWAEMAKRNGVSLGAVQKGGAV